MSAPNGLSKVVTSNTTFDHYQPLFSLYIDKVSNYMKIWRGSRTYLVEMVISILLNVNVNLDKTIVAVFRTTQNVGNKTTTVLNA